jgi:hypothetical protein
MRFLSVGDARATSKVVRHGRTRWSALDHTALLASSFVRTIVNKKSNRLLL